MSKPIQITVGGSGIYDPAADATECIIPELVGKEFYISRSGYGIIPFETYESLANGGFRLLDGLKFGDQEIWFVTITNSVEVQAESSYTNGFDYNRVMTAMLTRIGFRNPTLQGYNIVNSTNQQSASGRYYDDFHALVRIKNIKDTQEDPSISTVDFNAYLESVKRSSIMRCLNGVLNTREQFGRTLLYDREDNQPREVIPNTGLFVGFEIETPNDDTIAVQIESVSLLFDGDKEFNLYLFKDGKKSPIMTIPVTVEAEEATVVNLDNVILNYIGQATKGSTFYLGYFQDDLGDVQAIREFTDEWEEQYCFSASSISSPKKTGLDFERTNISESYNLWGLNLEISTFRDHTNAVIKKAHLFDELQGLQTAYIVLENILYSTASNDTQRVLQDQILKAGLQMDLNGAIPAPDSPQTEGLSKRIKREMDRVRNEFYPKPKATTVSVC
jgi:hypothetical protein